MSLPSPLEAELSEQLRSAADYSEFKEGLVATNSQVRDIPVSDFDGGKIGMFNGDNIHHYFPHPNHKDEVISLAFDLAQDRRDSGNAAMQLGAAVLLAHPFFDGNGRTSRTVHAAIVGKTDEEITDLGIAKFHPPDQEDERARCQVDLTPSWQLEPYVTHHVYQSAGFFRNYYLAELRLDEEKLSIHEENRARLTTDSQEDLDTVFVINKKGEVDRDMQSLEFALNALTADGINLVVVKTGKLSTGEPRHIIDIQRTLHSLDDSRLQVFLEDVWRYRRLRAEVSLKCLAANELGSCVVRLQGPEVMSVASHYARLSHNLLLVR